MATAIYRRRRFPTGTVLLGLLLLVAFLYVLVASGANIPVPFASQVRAWGQPEEEKPTEEVLPENMVWVLKAARDIPAYRAISNDDLLEVKEGKFGFARYAWKAAEVEENGLFTVDEVRKIKGRVLRRPKDRGMLFSESDFFEKGTREGYTAGIPTNYLGLRVEVGDIEGMAGLTSGDRFDLLSVRKNEDKDKRTSKSSSLTGIHAQRAALMEEGAEEEPDAYVETIVINGVVVTGVHTRTEFETSTGLMSGAKTKKTPKMEMFIAVHESEASGLVERLGVGDRVYCLPHSGRGEARDEDLSAERPMKSALVEASADLGFDEDADEPAEPSIEMIEVIRGDDRVIETTVAPTEESR